MPEPSTLALAGLAAAAMLIFKKRPMPTQPHLAKYIIINFADKEQAIVFPAALQHSHMLPQNARPVAAGFYSIIDHETLLAAGVSETLNLKSRGEKDAALIKKLLTN